MRGERENLQNTRTLSGYFSPGIKVKDFALQQPYPHHITSYAQETPMKPSQVPNRLPHPAPRTMVPFHTHHFPVSPCQDQRHKQTPSKEKLSAAVDSSCTSLKRRGEFEDGDHSAVKLHRRSENSCKAQTPKAPVCNSLSTSPMTWPAIRQSPASEQPPKSTDSQHWKGPGCGQSTCSEPSFKSKPNQSPCTSPTPELRTQRQPAMGAKQAYIQCTQSHTLRLMMTKDDKSFKKRSEANDKPITFSSSEMRDNGSLKDNCSSPSHHFGGRHGTSVLPVKTPSKSHQLENRKQDSYTPKPASKQNSDSQVCHKVKRSKTSLSKRRVSITDDIDDLFTPDPLTYQVKSTDKTSKPKRDERVSRSSTSEKSCSSHTLTSSSTAFTESSSILIISSPHAGDANIPPVSSQSQGHQLTQPFVTLKRMNVENLRPPQSKDKHKYSHSPSPNMQCKDSTVKHEKHRSSNSVCTGALDTDSVASGPSSAHPCNGLPVKERQANEEVRLQEKEVDPLDEELDFGLSLALDMDLAQSSQSSDDEQLLSLQEMMDLATKLPGTPEKEAFSEPGTPGPRQSKKKAQQLPPTTKSGNYKNSLDQMLKEINTTKKLKEVEMQLLTSCKEDLLRITEYQEAEENRDNGISSEHQEFLQRYKLSSTAIKEVPPGEEVFNLEKFGQIFNHDTLQLRKCMVNPEGAAQKTLLWSSPMQLRLNLNIGLFHEAYNCHSPCPTQVTRFLFKMMSVHNERMVSDNILQTLCDIASTAAYQIVKNESQKFEVWVPSLADVALVLINMGVSFVTLFPFEDLQPPFTEGDLLEDVYIKVENSSSNKEQSVFPEHNCINVLKYLSYCMGLCPRAYSDRELLLLLTVVGRVGLDQHLILLSTLEIYPLLYKTVNNFRDWNAMLPRICLALTDLTDDHHNMCLLVSMLPDNTRGKQLRRHLSLSMISKLLDGNCTYSPTESEIQLSELRRFLSRMQPSTLLRNMQRNNRDKEDMATMDQQSYYLCYSLLTLTNEASNFQFFQPHQKKQLLSLCSDLEMHVKCDIRESEKCLYRSKVKDLVARIDTKWQMLLRKTRPLNGKLYDYWQPLSVDTFSSSQEQPEVISDDERQETDVEEISETEENDVEMMDEDDTGERDDEMDEANNSGENMENLLQMQDMPELED